MLSELSNNFGGKVSRAECKPIYRLQLLPTAADKNMQTMDAENVGHIMRIVWQLNATFYKKCRNSNTLSDTLGVITIK